MEEAKVAAGGRLWEGMGVGFADSKAVRTTGAVWVRLLVGAGGVEKVRVGSLSSGGLKSSGCILLLLGSGSICYNRCCRGYRPARVESSCSAPPSSTPATSPRESTTRSCKPSTRQHQAQVPQRCRLVSRPLPLLHRFHPPPAPRRLPPGLSGQTSSHSLQPGRTGGHSVQEGVSMRGGDKLQHVDLQHGH